LAPAALTLISDQADSSQKLATAKVPDPAVAPVPSPISAPGNYNHFDDSEDDCGYEVSEPASASPQEVPDDFHAEDFTDVVPPLVKHKRLRGKTAFSSTSYGPPTCALHSRSAASLLKRKAADALKADRKRRSAAKTAAWVSTRNNIEATVQAIDDSGYAQPSSSEGQCARPHVSHTLAKIGILDAFYCTRCVAYSSGAMSLRSLSTLCKGSIPKGFSRVHRLLQLGILPGPGVNIPPGLSHKRKRCW
jgi:hypothetical protein